MTIAMLTLQGMSQIAGEVVAGVDYALFQASTVPVGTPVHDEHEADLIIDGKIERAVVENYQATEHDGCEVTLRRIKPAA